MTTHLQDPPSQNLSVQNCVTQSALLCETIEGGIVPVRAPGDKPSRHLGGVYRPDGEIVSLSLQKRRYGPKIQPFSPDSIRALKPRRIPGQVMFGGVIVKHYGHFTLESTARLWWLIETGYEGPIVFQTIQPGVARTSYIASFFELLGISDRIIFAEEPLQFDSIIVPEQAIELCGVANAKAQIAFRAIGRRVEATLSRDRPRKVYISRTRLSNGLCIGEDEIEAALVREGYTVLHPQSQPLFEQVALVCGADRVAGTLGSGMHNLVYAGPKEVTYICRVAQLDPTYTMIDALAGHDAHYIFGGLRNLPINNLLADPYLLDVGHVLDEMKKSGWLCDGTSPVTHDADALRRIYMAEWHLQRVINVKLPMAARIEGLTLAAALRPGDLRTLAHMVAALLEARRLELALHFAIELLHLKRWSLDATRDIAEQFIRVGAPNKAKTLLSNGKGLQAAASSNELMTARSCPAPA